MSDELTDNDEGWQIERKAVSQELKALLDRLVELEEHSAALHLSMAIDALGS
jgi:hypothetical protein